MAGQHSDRRAIGEIPKDRITPEERKYYLGVIAQGEEITVTHDRLEDLWEIFYKDTWIPFPSLSQRWDIEDLYLRHGSDDWWVVIIHPHRGGESFLFHIQVERGSPSDLLKSNYKERVKRIVTALVYRCSYTGKDPSTLDNSHVKGTLAHE